MDFLTKVIFLILSGKKKSRRAGGDGEYVV
jgi:hypothetical protein